jgi:hypothetical protein
MRTHLLTAALVLFGVAGLGAETGVSLEGVWKIAERITPGTNPRANGVDVRQDNPRPSLLIFTKGHYSWMIEMGGGSRPEVATPGDPQHLTDAEKIARYEQWRPFTANSGTYEIAGPILIRHPIVAKNVEVMKQGTETRLEIRVENPNAIWLIPTGELAKTEPRIKLTRLE